MIIIEHNLDVIKTADWLVDMGPEGGHGGGLVVAQGTPEQVAAEPASHTGKFLRDLLGDQVSDAGAPPVRSGSAHGTRKAAAKAVTAKKTSPKTTSTKKNATKKDTAAKTSRTK